MDSELYLTEVIMNAKEAKDVVQLEAIMIVISVDQVVLWLMHLLIRKIDCFKNLMRKQKKMMMIIVIAMLIFVNWELYFEMIMMKLTTAN
ncbi:MAG: hypothetical protein EZS28_014517 [Streblomastix strix]|uniref:Uncharacterized protein n=1 Tax=Streblomastix strix TaxID=222440 RepID=A0A5J4W5W8_9EUKA|nr:MAG: hypothetical protein EZS28_014517 [Streblomastix strix]